MLTDELWNNVSIESVLDYVTVVIFAGFFSGTIFCSFYKMAFRKCCLTPRPKKQPKLTCRENSIGGLTTKRRRAFFANDAEDCSSSVEGRPGHLGYT